MGTRTTLFDKIWQDHVVADLGDDFALIAVDRHIVHEFGGRGFVHLNERGLDVQNPELTLATADHTVTTLIAKSARTTSRDNPFIKNLRENAKKFGIRFFDPTDDDHGIVHVIVPEQAMALPGMTLACGDSHSCTIGALGVLSWGIGQSELVHVLATQASVQQRPKTMRIYLQGTLPPDCTPKDAIMDVIGKIGAAGASGFAVEFAGPVIEDMSMEGRLTVCNMAIEMGARFALIAPDDVTFDFLQGRKHAPTGEDWDRAMEQWKSLKSDPDAVYDREEKFDMSSLSPQVTWGTSPEQVIPVAGNVPDPNETADEEQRVAIEAALAYTNLPAGAPISGTPVDWVFIGSCTNARLSDLEEAAKLAKGRKVKDGLSAWVVPGSRAVKAAAEAKGLDQIFMDAGFEWGEPGCSMCGGSGGALKEQVPSGQRILSTSNRNFIGRQGAGSRTHLASPKTAVATAILGRIADYRSLPEAAS